MNYHATHTYQIKFDLTYDLVKEFFKRWVELYQVQLRLELDNRGNITEIHVAPSIHDDFIEQLTEWIAGNIWIGERYIREVTTAVEQHVAFSLNLQPADAPLDVERILRPGLLLFSIFTAIAECASEDYKWRELKAEPPCWPSILHDCETRPVGWQKLWRLNIPEHTVGSAFEWHIDAVEFTVPSDFAQILMGGCSHKHNLPPLRSAYV